MAALTTSATGIAAAFSVINRAKLAADLMTFHISKSLLDEQPSVPSETFIPFSFAFTHSKAPLASFRLDPGQ